MSRPDSSLFDPAPTMRNTRCAALLCLFLAISMPSVYAQWSSNPALNLVVSDAPSDQVQPKLAATADGGCYVSWFDGGGTGFDVRLQRLDSSGNELWPHNGVLVADRGFSSTQDYGLDVDATGAALLAFRDDQFPSVQITVQRVTPLGSLAFGPTGIQVTSTTGFLSPPKVAGVSNGDLVVAWADNGTAMAMRLTSAGINVWGTPVTFVAPAGFYTVSDLHDSGQDVLLSIVHQTGPQFSAPKHLIAQKLDASGAPLWGAQPLAVFDGGSLQIGNFPPFVPDGSGGAVFGWYGVSPLQCYAQRILSNGTEAFPHNGTPASTNMARVRVSPSVAFHAPTDSTLLFWTEQSASQSQSGVFGQRFDSAGGRQWGPDGAEVMPVGAQDIAWVRAVPLGLQTAVAWLSSPSFGSATTEAALVDFAGHLNAGPLSCASTPSGKSRLAAVANAEGQAFLAWNDDRADVGDILAQNLRADGGLGNGASFPRFCLGHVCPCGNHDANAGCANSTGQGASLFGAGSTSATVDDFQALVSSAAPNRPALLFHGTQALQQGEGVVFGDGLRCVGGSTTRVSVQFASAAGSLSWGPGLMASYGWNPGDTVLMQVWYRDSVGTGCGSGFNLTGGLELQVSP